MTIANNNNLVNPRDLISAYHKSLIHALEIYTSQSLEQIDPNEIIGPSNLDFVGNRRSVHVSRDEQNTCLKSSETYAELKALDDPYTDNYSFTPTITKTRLQETSHTFMHDYFELSRNNAIKEIKRVEEECLRLYDSEKATNSNKIMNNEIMSEDELEELRAQLFGKKFCFLINTEFGLYNEFRLLTVVADFYLSQNEIDIISRKMSINGDPQRLYPIKSMLNQTVDEKSLMIALASKYIFGKQMSMKYDYEVIHIAKKMLFSIEKISLNSIHVNSIKFDGSFDLTSLKSFELQPFTIDATKANLNGLTNVEYLSLGQVSLCDISFEKLSKLLVLSLNKCSFAKIDPKLLENLTNLKFLAISGCFQDYELILQLPVLSKNLKFLSLTDNDIGILKPGLFPNVKNSLVLLNLSFNKTKEILEQTFENLPNLRRLELSRNYLITLIASRFSGLSSLKELLVKNNKIKTIQLKGGGSLLPNLEVLDLSQNDIEYLEEGAFFGLRSLKVLDLTNNPVDKLGNVFEGLDNLEVLRCFGERKPKDGRIEKAFLNGMPNLRKLEIPRSDFRGIDEGAFKRVALLEELNLSGNRIKLEKGIFKELKHLRCLNLSENFLENISESSFEGLDSLEKLGLNHNNLKVLDGEGFSGLQNLKLLDLRANMLVGALDESILFEKLKSLKEIDLRGNPLIGDKFGKKASNGLKIKF